MKHIYKIILNKEVKNGRLSYNFGRTNGINIIVGKQKAVINYELSVMKSIDDIISLSDLVFRDAYRKVHLIHAIRYNCGFSVFKITVFIDEKRYEITNENDLNGHFPYMFSMMEGKRLMLTDKWINLETAIVNNTKSIYEKDLRFASAFSLLISMSREYSIDIFTSLWTSLNSYYNYISGEVIRNYNIFKGDKKKIERLNDSQSISLLASYIETNGVKMLSNKQTKQKWKSFYCFEEAVHSFDEINVKELYILVKEELVGKELPSKYRRLSKIANEFGIKTFTFLLLVYPYYLRCNYFHGEKPSLLITEYNSYELSSLYVVNYFLSTFLNENIPCLFENDYFDEDKRRRGCEYLDFVLGR